MSPSRGNGVLLVCLLIASLCTIVSSQNGCVLKGGWDCFGGNIRFLGFGHDDDDFRFEFSGVYGVEGSGTQCDVYQKGHYSIDGNTITATFTPNKHGDVCTIGGDTPVKCHCTPSATFKIYGYCSEISGPSGEACIPAKECGLAEYKCTHGDPIANPLYVPTVNGCGPANSPVTAPAFSFLECCNQHDTCYGTCGISKLSCDNDFYQCMACSCHFGYKPGVKQSTCLQAACTYHHLVEAAGCNAYLVAQKSACICPSVDAVTTTLPLTPHVDEDLSKFGTDSFVQTASRVQICKPPFQASCPVP